MVKEVAYVPFTSTDLPDIPAVKTDIRFTPDREGIAYYYDGITTITKVKDKDYNDLNNFNLVQVNRIYTNQSNVSGGGITTSDKILLYGLNVQTTVGAGTMTFLQVYIVYPSGTLNRFILPMVQQVDVLGNWSHSIYMFPEPMIVQAGTRIEVGFVNTINTNLDLVLLYKTIVN